MVLPPAHAADVHGDDAGDRFVGTGGLVLPGSVGQRVRHEVASCLGCAWRLTSPCAEPVDGVAFDGQPACLTVVRGCPSGHLLRSWFRPEGGAWRDLGLVCLPASGPVTIRELGAAAGEAVARGVPELSAGAQPAGGVVAQLPVHFRSGQPAGPQAWTVDLLGHGVAITARPVWTWEFGDGARAVTADPGGRYPDGGVSHAYRRPGVMPVSCRVQWSAVFEVDGLGPFPVPEQVQQEDVVLVRVGEGRAVLTAAGMAQ